MGNEVSVAAKPLALDSLLSTENVPDGLKAASGPSSIIHGWEFYEDDFPLCVSNKPLALHEQLSFVNTSSFLALHISNRVRVDLPGSHSEVTLASPPDYSSTTMYSTKLKDLVSHAQSMLTPRGMGSSLVDYGCHSLLDSAGQLARANGLSYSIYVWNGKQSSNIVRAIATAKGFELDHRLRRRLMDPSASNSAMEKIVCEMDQNCALKGSDVLMHAMRCAGHAPLTSLETTSKNVENNSASICENFLLAQRISGAGKRKRVFSESSEQVRGLLELNEASKMRDLGRNSKRTVVEDSPSDSPNGEEIVNDGCASEEYSSEEEYVSEDESDSGSGGSDSEDSEEEYTSDEDEQEEDEVGCPANVRNTESRSSITGLGGFGGFKLNIQQVKDIKKEQPVEGERDTPKSKRWLIKKYMNTCSQITDEFFLGGEPVAKDRTELQKHEITHILNCAGTVMLDHFPSSFQYKTLHLSDGEREDITCLFYDVLEWLRNAVDSGGKVFVHCQQGVSRSSAMTILYFMWRNNQEFQPMHEWIKSLRPISNPNANFTSSLMRWWKRIHSPVEEGNPNIFQVVPHSRAAADEIALRFIEARSGRDASPSVLDQRGAFIVCSRTCQFVWRGSACPNYLYEAAHKYTAKLTEYENAPSDVYDERSGSESVPFWNSFSSGKEDISMLAEYDERYDLLKYHGHERDPVLFRYATDDPDTTWEQVALRKDHLRSDSVYVLYNNKRDTSAKAYVWMGDDVPDSIADPYVAVDKRSEDKDEFDSDLKEDAQDKSALSLFGNDIARKFCLFFRAPIQTPVVTLRDSVKTLGSEDDADSFYSYLS